jgi:hypothetical protein
MTDLKAYTEARERVEAVLAYWSEAAPEVVRDDKPISATHFGEPYNHSPPLTWADLRLILAGPPVSREDVARVIDPSSWGRWDEVRFINYGGHCLNDEPLGRVDDPTCKRWAHASYNDRLPQSLAKANLIQALYQGAPK